MKKQKNNENKKLLKDLQNLHDYLRETKEEEWSRVLPFDELLFDRWEKAKFLKAKKGTSVYHNSYIFGDVSIGKNTWIGPNTILDASGGKISIGNYCSISAGVQIYTHDSVKWSLSGGKNSIEKNSVSIGNNCYLGPNVIVSKDSKIGNRCVIGAQSLINNDIPSNSIVFGIPGKIVGTVQVSGKNVKMKYFKK